MSDPDNASRFWRTLERYRLLASVISLTLVLLPTLASILTMVRSGVTATVPAWLVLVGTALGLSLGLLLALKPTQNPDSQIKNPIRRLYFEAYWEIDRKSIRVDGPFCMTCLARMNQEDNSDRFGRGAQFSIIYVCRNPDCAHKGAITKQLPQFTDTDQVLEHVRQLYLAEGRRRRANKDSRAV